MKPEAPSPGPADLIGRNPMLLESRGLHCTIKPTKPVPGAVKERKAPVGLE